MYGASEPAVGADWFSAKAQDEFTEGIVGERQADIKEIDVLVASGVGVFQDVPQRQFIRMDDSKRLATEGGVPEVGVLLAVDNGRTADDVVMITGEIESSVTFLLDEIEEFLVGDIAFGFQPMVAFQELEELSHVILGLHLVGDDAFVVRILDVMLQAFRNALFRSVAVQRVVDAHPSDGEELLLFQFAVGKHLLAEVADLDIQHMIADM